LIMQAPIASSATRFRLIKLILTAILSHTDVRC
jgi:hypothetical protein